MKHNQIVKDLVDQIAGGNVHYNVAQRRFDRMGSVLKKSLVHLDSVIKCRNGSDDHINNFGDAWDHQNFILQQEVEAIEAVIGSSW